MNSPLGELLERSWDSRRRPIRGGELRLELAVTAAFAAIAAGLLILAPPAHAPEPAAAGVVIAFAIAARVEFPVGSSKFIPTQVFLVPLFVVAPAQLVPALVFVAYLLAAIAAAASRDVGVDRVVFCAGDAAHALGPAIVLTVLADGSGAHASAGVIALAVAAQLLADFVSSGVHELYAKGTQRVAHLWMLFKAWGVDLALGSVGLLAAWAADTMPWAAIAPLPLVLLLGQLATDRVETLDASHERRLALERERERRQATARLLERHSRFLQDVSHALRTPVTIARGHLETLDRTQGVSAESAIALDELGRIERAVERLLILARAEERGATQPERLDAGALLEDVFVRWADTIARPWELGELAVGTIEADGDALRAALDALIENAVNHTTASEAIRLSCEASGDDLVIRVADEGTGIPQEALDHIFERFARADPTQDRPGGLGLGLGLTMVDAVAKAHGGSCTVSSSPAGSVFSLRLGGFRRPAGGLQSGHPGSRAGAPAA